MNVDRRGRSHSKFVCVNRAVRDGVWRKGPVMSVVLLAVEILERG